MTWDQKEQFGNLESAFDAALKANNLHRDGIYVPTIPEEATTEPQMLRRWLLGGLLRGWAWLRMHAHDGATVGKCLAL